MAPSRRSTPLCELLVLIALGVTTACSTAPDSTDAPWALTNVSVVDLHDGRVLPSSTIIVRGHRIVDVMPAEGVALSGRMRRIDGRGKFVIPGLWDMHAHLWDHEATPALFLANGVTGIRDMGSDTAMSVALRNATGDGRRRGPRVVTSGNIVDGPRDDRAPHRLIVPGAADAAAAVESLRIAGVDFVKVYHFLSRDAYFAVAREAKKRDLRIAGHLPPDVTIDDAIAAGHATIEHLYGIRQMISASDTAAVDEAARKSAAAGIWHTPTLAHYRSVAFRDAPDSPYLPDRHARYLTAAMRTFWDTYMPARERTPEQVRQLTAAFEQFQAAVNRMHALNVRLLAGSDNGVKYVYPGFGLHDELEQLVHAGLTPLDALRTATVNPAAILGLESSLGLVRAGMIADLVVLEANPLDDIANTRKIAAVVANGAYIDRSSLDEMLTSSESR